MRRFLKQYWNRTPEQLRVGGASALCGEAAFKEELHAKSWDSCVVAVCPLEPQRVDKGDLCWALVIFQTKRKRNGAKETVVKDVKPLRYCDVVEVGQGDGNVKLPKGVSKGYILTLSSQHPEFVADEFAVCWPKKKGNSAEAAWDDVIKRVSGEAAVLKTGELSLRGQNKKFANSETAYRFELKGPTLSYYDAAQKRLGCIHFEDPNTDIAIHEDEHDVFEVISPRRLYTLRASSPEDGAAWVAAMQHVKQRINIPVEEQDSTDDDSSGTEDSDVEDSGEKMPYYQQPVAASVERSVEPEPEPEPAHFDMYGRITCAGGHGLKGFVSTEMGYNCDHCLKQPIATGTKLWGCQICDWDVCEDCWNRRMPTEMAVDSTASGTREQSRIILQAEAAEAEQRAKDLQQARAAWQAPPRTKGSSAKTADSVQHTPTAPSSTTAAAVPVDHKICYEEGTIGSWLHGIKLNRYEAAMQACGYDEVEFLRDADEDDIEELLEELQMKRPHARAFRRAWSELVLPDSASTPLRDRQFARQEAERGSGINSQRNRSPNVRVRSPRDSRSRTPSRGQQQIPLGTSPLSAQASDRLYRDANTSTMSISSRGPSAENLYDRTARTFSDQIHDDILAFRLSNEPATLQDWARQTHWSGPAAGPVDSSGVPRIPQQGIFLEIWETVGSALPFAADGAGSVSPPPLSSPHTSQNHVPPVPPRPSPSIPATPFGGQNRSWSRSAHAGVASRALSPASSAVPKRPKQPQATATPAEVISYKETEMEQFVLGWTRDMLVRLGESAEDCPLTAGTLAESLSMSLAALSTVLPAERMKDLVRHHMLQLAGLV